MLLELSSGFIIQLIREERQAGMSESALSVSCAPSFWLDLDTGSLMVKKLVIDLEPFRFNHLKS